MNPINTPFLVQTVTARKREPKRTIFEAYQTLKKLRSREKKKKKKTPTMSSCFFANTQLWLGKKFEAFFNQHESFAFDIPTKEPKILRELVVSFLRS